MDYGCLVTWKHKHVMCVSCFKDVGNKVFICFKVIKLMNCLNINAIQSIYLIYIPMSFLVVGCVCVCVCYEDIELNCSKINITSHARIDFKPHQIVSVGIYSRILLQCYVHTTILRIPCPLYLIIHPDAHAFTYKEFNVYFKGMQILTISTC